MTKPSMRTFYTVAATQTVSILGSSMTSFALAIWIFTETGNTTPILLVGVMRNLPRIFFNSFAGVFADRLNRKMLIVVSDALQALPTLFLMFTFLTGSFQLWMLYAATVVQAIFGMVQGPAIYASVTMLVPDSHRDRANGILETMGPAAGIFAPIIGGFLYALVGVAGVMAVDVLSFLVAVFVIAWVHIPQPKKSKESEAAQGSVLSEVIGGAKFLLSRKPLLMLSAYFLIVNFLEAGIWPLMTPFLLTRTDYNEELLGILSAMISIGMVAGGLIPMVFRGSKKRIHTIMPLMIISSIMMILFAVTQQLLLLAMIGFIMMLPSKWTNALVSSIQQSKIPPDMQGRFFALAAQIAMFAMPTALLITGPLIDRWLIPLTDQPAWATFAPIFGTGEGGALALYIFTSSVLVILVTIAFYATPMLRNLETILPDYVAEADEAEDIEPLPTASTA